METRRDETVFKEQTQDEFECRAGNIHRDNTQTSSKFRMYSSQALIYWCPVVF